MKNSNYLVVIGGAILIIIIVFSSVVWVADFASPRVSGSIVCVYMAKSISNGQFIKENGNVRADVDTNGDGIADLIGIKFDIFLIRSDKYLNAEKKSCVVVDRGRGYGGPSICHVK